MTNQKKITKVLYIFLVSHLLIWTLIPSLSNINLPLDTIEALAWGSNLDWGFNKHPPFSAFAVEVFFFFFWVSRLGLLPFKPNFRYNSIYLCLEAFK